MQLTFESVEGFLSPSEIVQVSTCQVPVGEHSIFDHLRLDLLSEAEALVYLKINECSHWATGKSHGLSYTRLSRDCGMSRSQVISAVNGLVAKGWLTKNVRGQNLPNTYEVVHHLCDPVDAPLDKDGLPKKCAMPRGAGSAFTLLAAGRISWQACLYWHVCKMLADWTSNFVSLTIAQAREWLRFGNQTICDIRKSLSKVGLLERFSEKFEAFVCRLLPLPYEKRRKRRRENPKGMRCDGKFYYSFNELWRVSREDGRIQTKEPGSSKWRHANERELEGVNRKIHADFMPIVRLVTSPAYQRWRCQAAA